jgi:hypothetical protein
LLNEFSQYHTENSGRILSEKVSTNSNIVAWLDVRRAHVPTKLCNPDELGSRMCSELS